jgi:serine protease inhibitor
MIKMIPFYICLTITISMFDSCEKQKDLPNVPVLLQLSEKGQFLVNSASDFGIDLFKKTIDSETEKDNLMVSPYSVSMALAMTYNGANGDTKTAMGNTLHLNGLSTDEININFKQITQALFELDPNVELSMANSIWYRNNFSVLQDFIDVNRNFYNAEISPLDFNSPTAMQTINNWVSENTNSKIPQIIQNIDNQMVMFLINAIYFKGPWKYKFDGTKNFNYTFSLADGSTKLVEMMTQNADLLTNQNDIMTMVEVPYGRGNWAMDLILPNPGKSISDVTNALSDETWNSWISNLSLTLDLSISFPPFKFEYDKNLNQVLSDMGMTIALDRDNADFSKINTSLSLYISLVQHSTFIEVNEEGTEAAAATSVNVGLMTSNGTSVIFDRPFIFVIREISSGTILFIGKLGNPVI